MALLFKLVTKPLLLVILVCEFSFQSICIVIQTWIELLRDAVYLHLVIMWRPAIWVISMLSLPVRAFSALYNERMLEMQLGRVRTELDDVLWERKELEKQLHIAITECRMIDDILTELENKHDDALVQIELLVGEVRDLKDEIRRLKEVEGKSFWDDKVADNADKGNNSKKNPRIQWPIQQHDPVTVSKYNTILAKRRDLTLSRSLFSAILTLLVGMIVWEAKDPCIPLILALFTVVAMSLSSVIKFFNTIQHKPTTDAVALLSLNWFILGMLMYPTSTFFARVSIPFASRFLGRMFNWLTS